MYEQGETLDWRKAQIIAKEYSIDNRTEIMQACELAVVLTARKIAHNDNSIRQQYEEMKDLYERQVNIQPIDTKSKTLQQYSTPCPLSYLLGKFVQKGYNGKGKILEPSAGNGLLTIAFEPNEVCANEIDEIRAENLKQQGFYKVTSFDASDKRKYNELPMEMFSGIITNPPFATLLPSERIERNGWQINTLDYKMAILALDHLSEEGKGAIIVGGKMWDNYWKPLSGTSNKKVLFGQWKTFLGYLYAQYNVVDVIYVNSNYIYRKQGTQYPIVIILINGRHQYDESNKPNYVFDPERDVIIDTYDQLFDRMMKHLAKEADDDELDASKIHFNPNDDSDITTDTQNIIDMAMSYEHKPKYKVGDWFIEKVKHYESYETYYKIIGIHRDKKVLYDIDGYDDSGNPLYHFLELEESYIDDNYTLIDLPKFIKHKHLILAQAKIKLAKARAKALNLYIFAQKAQDKDKELMRGKIGGISGIDEYKTFIQNALSSNNRDKIECTELISEHSKRIVNYLLNKNIAKYYIKSTDIRHSKNKHGKQTEYHYGQIPITDADLLKIPEILSSPTNIDLPTANPRNGQGIRFIKEYPDGKIYCVMVDEYETEELSVKTSYKKPPLQGNDAIIDPELNVRNARALPMLVTNVTNFFRIQ